MKSIILPLLFSFLYCNSLRSQVVINELFPDPSPAQELPEKEFVELYNTTSQSIDLSGYQLADASRSVFFPNGTQIDGNGYLIVCSSSAVGLFEDYGATVGLNRFPSLNNSGDQMTLRNANGGIIDFVPYTSAWYKDDLKRSGGWTLERKNPTNICDGEENWAASTDAKGGTPGAVNSIVDESFQTTTALELVSVWLEDEYNLEIVFNKKPNENQVQSVGTYVIQPSVTINSIDLDASGTVARLLLDTPINENQIYTLSINALADCSGDTTLNEQATFGIPETPEEKALVINELLFNPATGGVDFIEIANTTNKLFALDGLTILELNIDNPTVIDDFVKIEDTKRYIQPNELLVLTTKPEVINEQYSVGNPENLIKANIPSYADEEGIVSILNARLDTLDQFHYYESYHFEGLNRYDGVSLERLDKTATTQEDTNWFSASVASGGATPTAENSQQAVEGTIGNDDLVLSHEIFTPDNDGQDDFLTIKFSLNVQGATASVYVYNVRGYLVKTVLNNQLIGATNQIRWTGLDDSNQPLPIGHYIIVANYYNADGKETIVKKKVVLSRRR